MLLSLVTKKLIEVDAEPSAEEALSLVETSGAASGGEVSTAASPVPVLPPDPFAPAEPLLPEPLLPEALLPEALLPEALLPEALPPEALLLPPEPAPAGAPLLPHPATAIATAVEPTIVNQPNTIAAGRTLARPPLSIEDACSIGRPVQQGRQIRTVHRPVCRHRPHDASGHSIFPARPTSARKSCSRASALRRGMTSTSSASRAMGNSHRAGAAPSD
jgi:hypothetical protein